MITDRASKWLSLIANFGVIAGLVLVATELQQNTELMRVQINQSRADAAMVSNEQLFNSDYIPGVLLKIVGEQELSAEDRMRYVSWFRSSNRNQDNVLSQYDAGMLGENTPRSVSDFAVEVIGRSTYSREVWNITKVGYSDRYVAFVEKVLREASSD